ncbi:hypothetical protein AB5N19_04871 [Seiridium cardinale]|uniref:PHD and RING finger domain-containing protein n=1 Tax=Seiridium cardinale TaxID=138064 RepID=A0ABR2XFN3_9PEZI
MADQCIVCLENLDVHALAGAVSPAEHKRDVLELQPTEQAVPEPAAAPVQTHSTSTTNGNATTVDDTRIAEIEVCGHILHDSCLREWTGKANSCPICRQSFNFVNVYDRVGGTRLSSYTVEDKKQVAEFDAQAWLDDNPEDDEPAQPCIICQNSDHEELTLLCDSCDAPYHTYCVGLDCVPRGHWLCMECNAQYRAVIGEELEDADDDELVHRRSDYLPRTQATMRRARRRARSDEWQGAWGQIASHIFDALDLDLDNHDDDEALQNYRRAQRRRERERQEYQRWQQRLNIANRLGAGDTFATNLARGLPQRTQQHRQPARPPPPPQETVEEKKAWGALEKAMEASSSSNATTPNRRKRKSRSATASPREPVPEPERRLKRPRTRRMPQSGEASSSRQTGEPSTEIATPSSAVPPAAAAAAGAATTTTTPTSAAPSSSSVAPLVQPNAAPSIQAGAPTFLSSLLKEVEASTPSDDENVRNFFGSLTRPSADASSPAGSPSPSGPSSPRALSATPPPRGIADRPGSPLTLSSHIEPIYPPMASFSPSRARNGGDQSGSDSESTSRRRHRQNGSSQLPSIHNPRPRRQNHVSINTDIKHTSRSPESSPVRESLSLKAKESISAMIKAALKPHYKSGSITADEYTIINRDLSRRLYREVPEDSLSEETRQHCEKLAYNEVAKAVSNLKEIKV